MKKNIYTDKWDAELNTDTCDRYNNAEITLTLKLCLRQINPAGGAAEGTYHDYGDPADPTRKIIRWTPGAWTRWKDRLCGTAQTYWHGRFWLVNNFAELEFEDGGKKYRPNIWCRFRIKQVEPMPEGVAGPVDCHHMIDVVRLHHSEKWFGSHATLYDSRDINSVQKGTDSSGKPIMQQAHVHEVGHLLGLGHIDQGKAHCPEAGDTNAAICYGVADNDKKNVMGQGMALTTAEATPWRRAAVKLVGKGVVATLTDWEARKKQHYPRLPAEVAANRAITVKPSR